MDDTMGVIETHLLLHARNHSRTDRNCNPRNQLHARLLKARLMTTYENNGSTIPDKTCRATKTTTCPSTSSMTSQMDRPPHTRYRYRKQRRARFAPSQRSLGSTNQSDQNEGGRYSIRRSQLGGKVSFHLE